MSAENKKVLNDILGRLDYLILQNEDQPEVYTMQRVARHVSNIDVTTTSLLDTMKSVFKINEKQAVMQKSLFQRIGENFQNGSNKLRASIISLTDVIKTTLDFKGHLSRIERGIQEAKITAKLGFIRMQEGFGRWMERLIFRVNDMKRLIGMQKNASDDLNSFLTSGAGNNSPLTVGFISGLYKKIFAYEQITRARDRKVELQRYKQDQKFQRSQASDLRRIANHLTGKQLGWIARLFQIVGIGLAMLGGQIVSFSGTMAAAAAAATKFGKLGKIASSILLGFGKFTGGAGNIVQKLATDMSGTIKSWMWFVVKRTFFSLGRMVAIMMNPVALAGMLAGYGLYQLFGDEIDRVFTALKSIFSDPDKRKLLFSMVTDWFSETLRGIGEWFGIVGEEIKKSVPEGAVDTVVSTFESVMNVFTGAIDGVVNAINSIIAGVMSIPDSFKLLVLAIDDMILGIKEMVGSVIDFIPGIDVPDWLSEATIDKERNRIDVERSETNARMDQKYATDYLGKASDAIVQGAKSAGQFVVDGVRDAGDYIREPAAMLATSTEGLNRFLSAELEKKALLEESMIQAERQRMITEGIEGAKTVSNAAILNAISLRDAAYNASQQAAAVGNTMVNNAISSVTQNTSFTSPLTVDSAAKDNGSRVKR